MFLRSIFLTFDIYIIGILSLTVSSSPEINVTLGSNSSIKLNCTFVLEDHEVIGSLSWEKKTNNNNYESLANFFSTFSQLTSYGKYLQNRSERQTFLNGSSSAVLTIKYVRCEDVGQYRCFINYGIGNGINLPGPEPVESHTIIYVQGTTFMRLFNYCYPWLHVHLIEKNVEIDTASMYLKFKCNFCIKSVFT